MSAQCRKLHKGDVMCEDLEKALEMQQELGIETTKGAILLFKAVVSSIHKMNRAMKEYVVGTDKRLTELAQDIKYLKDSFEEYKMDATKYRLIVELIKALFGTTKRSILTLVWFAVLVGVVHLKDIIDLLKALI